MGYAAAPRRFGVCLKVNLSNNHIRDIMGYATINMTLGVSQNQGYP